MSWFDKLMPSRIRTEASSKRAVPEGLWAKCPGCSAILYRAELERIATGWRDWSRQSGSYFSFTHGEALAWKAHRPDPEPAWLDSCRRRI